jgi:hypothetical protein
MFSSRSLPRIIAVLLLSLTLLVLSGCSAARLGYGQAADLLYWWIDGYFDVNETQAPRLRDELSRLHQWHRASELPKYAHLLQKTQQAVPGDVSAAQVCALYGEIRRLMDNLAARALGPAAELALTLTPSNLERLQRKFDKNTGEFARNFQHGTDAERLERRLKTAIERAESFYGSLDEAQLAALRSTVLNSGFDHRLSAQERLRRQQDLLQTLRRLRSDKAAPAQARSSIAAYIERSWASPDPRLRAYQERLLQEGCANVALVHNSTNAAQRAKAVQYFNNYELDALSLMVPPRS